MQELKTFEFENHQVRTLTIDDEPYFVGKDVAEILGYKKARNALSQHVDDEDKKDAPIQGPLGGRQATVVITESGLYSLIMSSKLPTAKKFKHWVTSSVLPTIRKHGAYMTDQKIEEVLTDPDTIIQLATQLKEEREARLIAEQQVNELKPKATYYDRILANPALVTITVIAKDYGMSGAAMNKKLHQLGVQYRQGNIWLLYSKYQKLGWTQSETHMIERNDGTEKAVVNTKWTQKGRLGLYELLKQNDVLPLIEKDEVA
ncbi:phage antirepressor [Lactobacillus sp. ESL0236]|uniref:phage antirepressor n=1 Tax=unclassified Lactobacillus TaxID=2620435 RepID=UPI000EFBD866|nr:MULTISPECIES: phage antirepressor [unclassified Lactobacillus]RMC38150.1 phage antirepressor [Lactobacillus sp. ESL0237]RMC42451.1 phage antirepressor [Lactobacillus sp. ESL0234]RMC42617.1 phage antirepressor [Lactobacillus sp. ESL0236]